MSAINGKRVRRSSPSTRAESDTPAPAQPQNKKDKSGRSTFMDKWVEPPVAATKPSFEDHGGAAYGVTEHMQPLGTLPNPKVKARVKPDAPRKSVLGKTSAATASDAQDTPEGTPSFEAPPAAQAAPREVAPAPPIIIDDDRDEDYAPKPKKKESKSRERPAKRSNAADTAPASSAAPAVSTKHKASRSRLKGIKDTYTKDDDRKLKQIVNAAIKRARDVGNPGLGDAVREIYKESQADRHLRDLLEAILAQTANAAEAQEFQEYVKKAKRRLQTQGEAPGRSRTPPPEKPKPNDSTTSLSQSLPRKPTPAADIKIPASKSTPRAPLPSPKISIRVKSPKKGTIVNGKQMKPNGVTSTQPFKKRSGSLSSTSSLSSLSSFEEVENSMNMDVDGPDELQTRPSQGAKPNGIRSSDRAVERGSLQVEHRERDLKRTSAEAELPIDDRDDVLTAKKQKLSETITRDLDWHESDIREPISAQPPPKIRIQNSKKAAAVPPPVSLAPGARSSRLGRSREVSADLGSPMSDLTPVSSRQSTPHVWKGPAKPAGKRAKTKQSPEKKHSNMYGGVSGAGGAARESPIGYDDNEELSDNNDFCSACGGSGFLLCCDGCDRSFHFTCLDPPLNQDASELNEPWFCFICVAKRPVTAEQPEKPPRGLFAPLISSLNKRNPATFSLPQTLREYFEGVATDRGGQYVEAVNSKTRSSRTGWDELPDFLKTKDAKGNTILCFSCGKSASGRRDIIPCDYCGEHWHLDCLDPPLANAPARGLNGRKLHDWMCPLHVDHELRRVDTTLLNPRRMSRKVHLRRPKNSKIVDTSLNRGFINNGVIEVQEDDSDSDDSDFYDQEDGVEEEATIYRLPAKGIKLDFIDAVKRTRVHEKHHGPPLKQARVAVPSQLDRANFARRSFREQQTALNLAQFASSNQDLELGGDQVEKLVGTLIAEAPTEVVDEMTAAEDAEKAKSASSAIPPSPPSSDQPDQLSAESRKELEMLQELIRRKLESAAKCD